jgi:hypothetical protein
MFQRTIHIHLEQFCRIGGKLIVPRTPHIIAHVQVTGSYLQTTREARAAAILTPLPQRGRSEPPSYAGGATKSHNTYRHVQGISADSASEADWAAISMGLELAMTHDEEVIAIENNCLSVVGALLMRDGPLRLDYARYWRQRILGTASRCQWVGLRWIPLDVDDLFSAQPLTKK